VTTSEIVQEDIRAVVELVGGDFTRLSGKSLLITGGTGFIGRYLLETLMYVNDRLLSQPCRVYATTRNRSQVLVRCPDLRDRHDLVLIEGDIRAFEALPDPVHFVIHAAASSDVRQFLQDPLATVDTIVDGTRAVLTMVADMPLEAFLFVSSGAVYGSQPPERIWLAEDDRSGPDLGEARSCYAEAKRYSELLCRIFAERHGVPLSVARLFTILGPYQDRNSTSAVIDFIRQCLDGDTITIWDNGQAIRSYCYVADAVVALWKLLFGPQQGGAVNVGSDLEAVSFVDLAHRVARNAGKRVTVVVQGTRPTGILGLRYAPDVTRLYEKTGFRPATTLDQALCRTIAWMKERWKEDVAIA